MGEYAAAAAIVGGAGAIGQYLAGDSAAQAQANIANAQLEEQRRTRAAAVAAAEPSLQEMQQIEAAIKTNTQDIERKTKILESTDPAIIEAGKQALSLLKGEEAATLAPIKAQREKERQVLKDKLRAQLGPGFENTTAGIQALAAFDEGTSNALGVAQQNSLAQLLGVAQNFSGAGLTSNTAAATSLAGVLGNQSSRRVSAINGTPITAAGSQFVGDLAQAQNMSNLFSNVTSLGVQAAISGAFSGKPTTNSGKPTTNTYTSNLPELTGPTGYLK